jgi:hypothetical protein
MEQIGLVGVFKAFGGGTPRAFLNKSAFQFIRFQNPSLGYENART